MTNTNDEDQYPTSLMTITVQTEYNNEAGQVENLTWGPCANRRDLTKLFASDKQMKFKAKEMGASRNSANIDNADVVCRVSVQGKHGCSNEGDESSKFVTIATTKDGGLVFRIETKKFVGRSTLQSNLEYYIFTKAQVDRVKAEKTKYAQDIKFKRESDIVKKKYASLDNDLVRGVEGVFGAREYKLRPEAEDRSVLKHVGNIKMDRDYKIAFGDNFIEALYSGFNDYDEIFYKCYYCERTDENERRVLNFIEAAQANEKELATSLSQLKDRIYHPDVSSNVTHTETIEPEKQTCVQCGKLKQVDENHECYDCREARLATLRSIKEVAIVSNGNHTIGHASLAQILTNFGGYMSTTHSSDAAERPSEWIALMAPGNKRQFINKTDSIEQQAIEDHIIEFGKNNGFNKQRTYAVVSRVEGGEFFFRRFATVANAVACMQDKQRAMDETLATVQKGEVQPLPTVVNTKSSPHKIDFAAGRVDTSGVPKIALPSINQSGNCEKCGKPIAPGNIKFCTDHSTAKTK